MFWHSLEAPRRGASNEYPKYVCFRRAIRKIFLILLLSVGREYPVVSLYNNSFIILAHFMKCMYMYFSQPFVICFRLGPIKRERVFEACVHSEGPNWSAHTQSEQYRLQDHWEL